MCFLSETCIRANSTKVRRKHECGGLICSALDHWTRQDQRHWREPLQVTQWHHVLFRESKRDQKVGDPVGPSEKDKSRKVMRSISSTHRGRTYIEKTLGMGLEPATIPGFGGTKHTANPIDILMHKCRPFNFGGPPLLLVPFDKGDSLIRFATIIWKTGRRLEGGGKRVA